MGITSDTDFGLSPDTYNAYAWIWYEKYLSFIRLGKNMFKMQIILHEVNENEIEYLLRKLEGLEDVCIRHKGWKVIPKNELYIMGERHDFVAHLASPYGVDSFICSLTAKQAKRFPSLL